MQIKYVHSVLGNLLLRKSVVMLTDLLDMAIAVAINQTLYVCSNINIYESILKTILHYATLYSPE